MNILHTLAVNGEEYPLRDLNAQERLGKLEADYRHIATYEHTADTGVKLIDITLDDRGNPFGCSDFLIYLTLPTNAQIANYQTQLYIGRKIGDWEVYMPQGFSTTATRRMRLHLYHAFDGYWVTDGVYNDNASQADYFVPNINNTNSGFGNLKSMNAAGKTITEWHFQAQVSFDKGTKIEIYGK